MSTICIHGHWLKPWEALQKCSVKGTPQEMWRSGDAILDARNLSYQVKNAHMFKPLDI